MSKKIVKRSTKMIPKDEVISVRFPAGTIDDIRVIQDALYFGRSVSDYVKECVLTNVKQDKSIITEEKNG